MPKLATFGKAARIGGVLIAQLRKTAFEREIDI
jgi:hypothetical protein